MSKRELNPSGQESDHHLQQITKTFSKKNNDEGIDKLAKKDIDQTKQSINGSWGANP